MHTHHTPSSPSAFRTSKIWSVLSFLLLLPCSTLAATFYVSPSGNDSNSGTQSSPFRSITRAQSAASSGDTVLLRGGTYSGFTIAGSDSNYNFVHHITKSGITYAAFPGETPIFNFAGTTTAKRVAAFRIAPGVTNVTFRGFHVTGVPVGTQKQSECFRIQGNAHFDRVTCRDSQANGFYFTTDGSGSCTNCDAYNLIGVGQSVGNTDGFGAHAGPVTFTGCRAWNCSDDGYDCISSSGRVIFDHCWAYNMRNGGDSNGFKVGGYGLTGPVANPMPSHIVRYCLSANNGSHGFYANHQPGKAADWTNNTAYNNSSANFNMLEQVSPTNRTDIPGTREVFHYNIAFTDTIIVNDNHPAANKTDNSWTKPGVSVSAADFQSLDATQMTAPRQADGSLPAIAFMRLTAGSDLAGMGCFADSAIDTLTVSPTSLSFGAATGSQTASITSNTSWTASDNQSWISLSPTSGSNNATLTVSVTQNTGASRSGTVTVTGGGLTRTISVTQAAAGGGTITLQAESGSLGDGTTIDSNNAGYNGTGFANFPTSGGTLTFNNVDGGSGGSIVLTIRYANGSTTSRTGTIIVNGVAYSVTFPSTGSWSAWATITVTLPLNSGTSNTIQFASTGQDLGNIDEITLPSTPLPTPDTYQAESGALAGGVTIDSNNAGFNGSGFANFPTSAGTLTFNNVDGNGGGAKNLAIRYALGATGPRTGSLTINGVTTSITFAPTGSWTTWQTLNVAITLNNNSTNTIQFMSTGQDMGNLDEITVP